MIFDSSLGFALLVAGLVILAVSFGVGFLLAFVSSLIYLRIANKKTKVDSLHRVPLALIIGILGGVISLWLAFRLDKYYGHKAYVQMEDFSLLMQNQYKVVSADFNGGDQSLELLISVPRDSVYDVRVRTSSVASGWRERYGEIPIGKDFWDIDLTEGINKVVVEVPGEYLDRQNLYLIVSIYPASKPVARTYVMREMNSLFEKRIRSLYEGIDYYAPEIPFSYACNNYPNTPCVKEEKLKVELHDGL